jgi:uncharacterized protein (TIGR02466 family)
MSRELQSIPEALQTAIQHHLAGELDDARAIYHRILDIDPDHADSLNLSGVICHQTGDQETAIELIEKAIRVAGPNAGYYINLGEAYRAFGRNQSAIEAFEHALELEPDDARVHNNLGIALQDQQRFDEAISAYRRAMVLAPGDVEVLLNLGSLQREFSRFDDSIDTYRQVIRLAPQLAAGHASLGIVLYESGDDLGAIASLEKAVQLDPLYLEAHENLKKVRWFRGEHDRVDSSFEQACVQMPGSATAFCHLGAALLLSREYPGAEKALLRAVELDPSRGDAFDALGQVYRNLGRLEPAIAAHQTATSRAPANALFREEFGITLLAARDFERAARELRTGHELHPRRSTMLGYLTVALNELGDPSVDELVDYEKYVRAASIQIPDGFDSVEAFNAALHEELKQQHSNPHHPMDQTMRGGTQTRNNLFQAPTGLVSVLKKQIQTVIDKYIDELEPNPRHPFLRFINRDYVFTGVWSTIIKERGYDGSHMHNEGWMSGTYYVKVPDFDDAQVKHQDGCIQFGEPNEPYASERNKTRRVIPPKVGVVVLFPSYYWHGVRSFDRNGVRHSVSYDLI